MRRALALVVAALAAAPAAAAEPSRALFDASGCRACHAVGGRGGNAGPDLSFVGLRRDRVWLDAWLKEPRALKPDTLMTHPGLSEGDRRGLVEFLSGLRGLPPGSRAWDVPGLAPAVRGKVLYAKAGCVACHGPAGTGGHPNAGAKGGRIPALAGVSETFSAGELVEKIRRGSRPEKADPAGPEPAVVMPAWGSALDESELAAVAEYLLSLGGAKKGEQW